MSRLVVRGGEVDGRVVDVAVEAGQITGVGTGLEAGGEVLDVGGVAVLPGLHDHHLHLLAMAAAQDSVDVRDVEGPDAFDAAVRAAVAERPGGVRVIGYHEHHAGPLDEERLRRLSGDVPVRVQHATGAAWLTVDGWRYGPNPAEADDDQALDLAAVGRDLLAVGVTGVTDATPSTDASAVRLLADAGLAQHVVVTGGLELPTGDGLPRGPVKLVIGDHELPELDDLAAAIAAAHDRDRPVAVHCVTASALALLLAAWGTVGAHPGDRVEHGAVIPDAAIAELVGLGVTVVTQPNFVRERGDRYRAEVDAVDQPDLWRCGSLRAAGVRVAAGTDAPYGLADPWAAMAAAVDRQTAGGHALGAEEAVTPEVARDLFLGHLDAPGGQARRVAPGALADLCVLDRPWADARQDLAAVQVRATVVGGTVHEV